MSAPRWRRSIERGVLTFRAMSPGEELIERLAARALDPDLVWRDLLAAAQRPLGADAVVGSPPPARDPAIEEQVEALVEQAARMETRARAKQRRREAPSASRQTIAAAKSPLARTPQKRSFVVDTRQQVVLTAAGEVVPGGWAKFESFAAERGLKPGQLLVVSNSEGVIRVRW